MAHVTVLVQLCKFIHLNFHISLLIYLLLCAAFTFLRVYPPEQTVRLFERAFIWCFSSLSVNWMKDDEYLLESTHKENQEYVLEIHSVQLEDAGEYTCIGNDGPNQFNQTSLLHVSG